MLQMRLSPLKQVELILTRALAAEVHSPGSPSLTPTASPTSTERPTWRMDVPSPTGAPEVSIRSGTGWKNLLGRRRRGSQARYPGTVDELDDARRILDACKEDIAALWKCSSGQIVDAAELDVHHHAR